MAATHDQLTASVLQTAPALIAATTQAVTNTMPSITSAVEQGSQAEASALDMSIAQGGVAGVFEWVKLQMGEVLDTLSTSSQQTGRQACTELRVSYEMKLSHVRTASDLRLQNQAVEMESTFNRKFEEKVKEVAGESGEALAEAHRRLEEEREPHAVGELPAERRLARADVALHDDDGQAAAAAGGGCAGGSELHFFESIFEIQLCRALRAFFFHRKRSQFRSTIQNALGSYKLCGHHTKHTTFFT